MLSLFTLLAGGCASGGWLNGAASLGGDTVGGRGTVRVLFINNTPHRAIFTAGVYDPADQDTNPEFVQFAANSSGSILEGESSSAILELPCAQAISIGTRALIDLVEANNDAADLESAALFEGVGFSSAAIGEDGDDEPDQGFAPAKAFLVGSDFPCNALLIVRFEFNDLGPEPFLIDFSYIPSESTR